MGELSSRIPDIIAAEINSIKSQTRNMILSASIEIGQRLVEVKSIVPHGEWQNWLKHKVDYSQSTANNLMNIYQEYGNNPMLTDESKSQALGNLGYTQAVALLSIPREERKQFVEEHDVENMSTRELQQAIKEKQELERQLAETRADLEEQLKQQSLFEEKLSEAEEKVDNERQALEKATERYKINSQESLQKIQQLQEELTKARAAGNSEQSELLQEQLDEASKDLQSSAERIEDLERQLKERPIEVEATTVIEKVPEEVEKELEELRKNRQHPALAKFNYQFDTLVSNFNSLLRTLDEIKELDERTYTQYTKATVGLINKMLERL